MTELKEVQTERGTLRYYDEGTGPVVLFLHGSGPGVTGWRNFRGILPTFAAHFRCLILEFPGFGVSNDFGGHPMIDAQSAVVPFLDALGVEKVPYEELNMTVEAIEADRRRRGEEPLVP